MLQYNMHPVPPPFRHKAGGNGHTMTSAGKGEGEKSWKGENGVKGHKTEGMGRRVFLTPEGGRSQGKSAKRAGMRKVKMGMLKIFLTSYLAMS